MALHARMYIEVLEKCATFLDHPVGIWWCSASRGSVCSSRDKV